MECSIRQTERKTDKQTEYCNPCCACVPRVKYLSPSVLTKCPIQVFPGDLLSPTHPDPRNPDIILGRSEFERRCTYTALLERGLVGGCEHPLFIMTRECLSNATEKRPATSHLLSTLEGMRTETEGGLLQLDIARVKTVRTLKAKDRRIHVLQVGSECG